MKGFIMNQNYTSWCGAHLKFLQIFQLPRYFAQRYNDNYEKDKFVPEPDDDPYESANFLFTNRLTNSSIRVKYRDINVWKILKGQVVSNSTSIRLLNKMNGTEE